MLPCSTPTRPADSEAPCRPLAIPWPPASTPMIRTPPSPTNGWNSPIAVEAEQGGDGCGGDTVLPGAGLGDDAPPLHTLRQQPLPEHVVDLVRARMTEVLALEVDPRAAAVLGEPGGFVQGRRPACVVARERREPRVEPGVTLRRRVRALQLDERAHERLGDEPAAVAAEVPARVGQPRHACFAAAMKSRSFTGSFLPGAASTPEFTSTPYGRATAIASATLSGVRPAERMMRPRAEAARASVHWIGRRTSPS